MQIPTQKPFVHLLLLFVTLFLPTSALKLKHLQTSGSAIAQTYTGLNTITVPESSTPETIQYSISFTSYKQGCDYRYCYYGWVGEYTTTTGGKEASETVYGYPKGEGDVLPVFQYKANSASQYVIRRHPKLSDSFVNIIEVSCEFYQPTLRADLEQSKETRTPYKLADLQQYKKQNPESSLIKQPLNYDAPVVASLQTQLNIKDIEAKTSNLKEQIFMDKEYNVIRRAKLVNLNLPTDNFDSQTEGRKDMSFISNVRAQIDRQKDSPASHEQLRKIIQGLKEFEGRQASTAQDIQKRRTSPILYRQDFKIVDTLTTSPQTITIKQTAVTLAPTKTLASAITCSLTNTPSAEIPIWSYQKLLFEKTIFGKKFSVTIKIEASIVNSNSIRFKGTIIYSFFGNLKTVQAFNYVKEVNLNWSKNYNINGAYSASIYIPLPPPVSFLGLNFAFTVSFSLSVNLYATTNPQFTNCIFKFTIGANVGTEVGVEASAAIRAVVIEGGAFIGGTLINLSTDPKMELAYNLQTKAVVPTITWYFYVKAFKFQWGFFYRYWKLFSGWSAKQIIAKWPISNGVTQTYLIYKT